jgi:hypothetical protein
MHPEMTDTEHTNKSHLREWLDLHCLDQPGHRKTKNKNPNTETRSI